MSGEKRAAIYLRRSREEKEDGYSLPAQRRKALARAESEGWRVVDVIEDEVSQAAMCTVQAGGG